LIVYLLFYDRSRNLPYYSKAQNGLMYADVPLLSYLLTPKPYLAEIEDIPDTVTLPLKNTLPIDPRDTPPVATYA